MLQTLEPSMRLACAHNRDHIALRRPTHMHHRVYIIGFTSAYDVSGYASFFAPYALFLYAPYSLPACAPFGLLLRDVRLTIGGWPRLELSFHHISTQPRPTASTPSDPIGTYTAHRYATRIRWIHPMLRVSRVMRCCDAARADSKPGGARCCCEGGTKRRPLLRAIGGAERASVFRAHGGRVATQAQRPDGDVSPCVPTASQEVPGAAAEAGRCGVQR